MPKIDINELTEEFTTKLRKALDEVEKLTAGMEHQDIAVGFTTNLEKFEKDPAGAVMTVSDTSFQAIFGLNDYVVVLFMTKGGERGYGLLDTDHMVCLPISLGQFASTKQDAPKVEQKNMFVVTASNLDLLEARAARAA